MHPPRDTKCMRRLTKAAFDRRPMHPITSSSDHARDPALETPGNTVNEPLDSQRVPHTSKTTSFKKCSTPNAPRFRRSTSRSSAPTIVSCATRRTCLELEPGWRRAPTSRARSPSGRPRTYVPHAHLRRLRFRAQPLGSGCTRPVIAPTNRRCGSGKAWPSTSMTPRSARRSLRSMRVRRRTARSSSNTTTPKRRRTTRTTQTPPRVVVRATHRRALATSNARVPGARGASGRKGLRYLRVARHVRARHAETRHEAMSPRHRDARSHPHKEQCA